MMNDRDQSMVVNKDEILELLPRSENVWFTKDYHLDAIFNFMVLSTLVSIGECEITLNSGEVINASNLEKLRNLQPDDYYNFANIKRPKDINIPVVRELTKMYCGKDMSNQLDQESTYTLLVNSARALAAECATFDARELKNGLEVAGVEVIDSLRGVEIKSNTLALKGFSDYVSTITSQAKMKNFRYDMTVVKKIMNYKADLEQTRAIIKTAGELNQKVQYLTQAKQYVPMDTTLAKNIDATVNKIADILHDLNDTQVEVYNKELDDIKAKYIKWYLEEYYKYCLSEFDEQKRVVILNSGEYRVCSVICICTLINTFAWNQWKMAFNQLKIANPNVESILRTTPYAGFNPLMSGSGNAKTIKEFKEDLEVIYNTWIDALKAYVQSPGSQEALSLMDEKSQNFLLSFASGMTIINDENSAKCLLQLLDMLSGGYEKVEITSEELAACISHPMTVGEAIAMLELCINKKCARKDRNKVRIVLSK